MSVRSSLSWSYASQAVSFVSGFVTSIFIARLLSPREVGVYASAMAVVGLLGVFTNVGLDAFLIKEESLDQEKIQAVFTINAIVAFISSFVLVCIAVVFEDVETRNVLLVISLVPLVSLFQFLPATLLGRDMNFKIISVNNLLMTLISNLMTVVCASFGLSSMSAALGSLSSAVVGTIILNSLARKHVTLKLSLKKSLAIVLFGFQMLTVGGATSFSINIGSLILLRVQGAAALGIYSRAAGISLLVFNNIYGLATKVVFAKMSEDLRETGSFKETFIVSLEVITSIMWPALIGLAILSGPFINLIYGSKWIAAATPLSILMIAQFIILAFGMNWEVFVLRDKMSLQTKYETVRAVVGLVLFAFGSVAGLTAASGAKVVEALFGFALYQPRMRALVGTIKYEIETVYCRSLILTASAVSPCLLCMSQFHWSPVAPLFPIILSVCIGIVLWFITLFFVGNPIAIELKKGFRNSAIKRLFLLRIDR